MIVYHQDNIAAFAGNHTFYWIGQPIIQSGRITLTSAAAANEEIEQARSIHRFMYSRIFGRVN